VCVPLVECLQTVNRFVKSAGLYYVFYSFFFTDSILTNLLALADEYQVDFLIDKCREYLEAQLSEKLGCDQVLLYLHLCHNYSHHLPLWNSYWEKALLFDYNKVKNNRHFLQLPDDVQVKLALTKLQAISTLFETYKSQTKGPCESQRDASYSRILVRPTFGHGQPFSYCIDDDLSSVCERCVDQKVLAEARRCNMSTNPK
jgi:hypothetical protein